jgi:DNA-binding beta-propeller fold protein YncE
MKRVRCAIATLILSCGVVAGSGQSTESLELKQKIPLPGVEGRIDHLAFDAAGKRLFVCALGNNTVEVVDLAKGQRVHSIAGLGAPQGVAYISALDRIFVASDRGGLCRIYDGTSYTQLAEIDLKDDADNVRYDEVHKKVYAGFGSGGIAVIDPAAGKEVSSIKLSAHPEAFTLEEHGKRIFINVPNSRQVAVINRDNPGAVATWRTDMAFGNFPMALDESHHQLFVGCRLPPTLVVLNTESGAVINKVNISGDPDDVFYDDKRHRVYVICGAGKIEIIEQSDAYKRLATVDTSPGARTGIFVPELATLFVAVPHHGSQPAEVLAYRIQ